MKSRSLHIAWPVTWMSIAISSLSWAQTSVTLNGASGSEAHSAGRSTSGGLTLSLGFDVEYLVVGGGGGGGSRHGGGGGAGGVLSGITQASNSSYSVQVGAGGAGAPQHSNAQYWLGVSQSGQSSSVFGVTAVGGGYGGGSSGGPSLGASGGGSSVNTTPGQGTTGQGYAGGSGVVGVNDGWFAGGGGGGAGTAGSNAFHSGGWAYGGNGGAGLANSITGSSVYYGGGGGGGTGSGLGVGTGGLGGGGNGGRAAAGTNGTANTGGGGGAGGHSSLNFAGGNGGSGVVILRYKGAAAGTGGNITTGTGTAAGYTLHTFTATGNSALDLSGLNLNNRLGAVQNGVISGTGNLTFTGPGTLTLNAANTYTGSTVVNAGTVMLGASGSLNSATVVNVASGATFHLNGRNQTVSGLHGAGSVALGSGILTINDNSNRAHSGVISGTGAITKSGSGTLTLSATNTYSGVTRINSGTLTIGSGGSIGTSTGIHIANGANFNVASASGGFILGATQNLSGGGTITGDVTIAGSHTPGFSPGLQSFANNLSYSAGSSITWELTSNTLSGRGTNFDGIDVAGNLNFAGPTSLNLDFNLAESQVNWAGSFWNNDVTGTAGWKIFGVNGSITGFENLSLSTINWLDSNDQSLSSLRPNASFSLFQGNDGVYLNYTAVPESSTAWIVSLAGSLALLRRRRGMA
ncbi:MAG: hypothetical protein RLZZ553_432 [Verrucomicrobiota bacterium]|jgi:autotransporter-associated beta strand protein